MFNFDPQFATWASLLLAIVASWRSISTRLAKVETNLAVLVIRFKSHIKEEEEMLPKSALFSTVMKIIGFTLIIFAICFFPVVAWAQTDPDPASTIQEALKSISDGFSSYGWLGALAGFLVVVVKLYRVLGCPWETLPKWSRYVVIFAFSGAGVGLMSFLGGVPIVEAITAGVLAALSAIGGAKTIRSLKSYTSEERELQKLSSLRTPIERR